MSLKNNLIRLMKEKKITIKELSCLAKISEPTIKRLRILENSNPTLDILVKLSGVFCIDISKLVQEIAVPAIVDHNILESLSDNLKKTSNKDNSDDSHLLNKNGLSVIDIEIFTLILKEIVVILNEPQFQGSYKEIIDFCYDTYNSIMITSASNSNKIDMIRLAIESFKRGKLLKEDVREEGVSK